MEIFGINLSKKKNKDLSIASVVSPQYDDGASLVSAANHYGVSLDLDGSITSENDLVVRYRETSIYPDCDSAIEDIVNDAIIFNDTGDSVELNLSQTKLSEAIQSKISEEFKKVLILLKFDTRGHDIFRTWYIDGRIFYNILIDTENQKDGISELRYINPQKIRKIKTVNKTRSKSGVDISSLGEEYYLYNDAGLSFNSFQGIKMTVDSIAYCSSGIIDRSSGFALSYLQKAIKPTNLLKMMEDSLVIYRISRAPERRVFYIDVGNLPKVKAEQYVQDMMNKFRNKLVYDATNGTIKTDKKSISILEDFWMPRREGCFSLDTKIKTLDGRDAELSELILEHEQGKQNWVYSVSPEGKVVPGMISWAGITKRNTEVIKVTLDNGEAITCTPEHKFILRNGEKIEARLLQEGSSLMPCYTEQRVMYGTTKYEYVQQNDTSKWSTTHKMVSTFFSGGDNIPENLLIMDKDGHEETYPQEDYTNKNSSVLSVDFLTETMDVGTLTIDGDNLYHDYHNFALSTGIFVMNSKGTEIQTLDGACLDMNTLVSLMDGRELSIRDIQYELLEGKQLWTYSCDEFTGEVKPGLISWAGVTQKSAKVMKLTLDNGEEIICTPDHKFPIYGKGFVEAKDFIEGESLIPLYRKKNIISKSSRLEYEQVFDNKLKKWIYTHRMVNKHINLPMEIFEEDFLDRRVVHHKDVNRFNNNPTNLCLMSWNDHSLLHQNMGFTKEQSKQGTDASVERWAKGKELNSDVVEILNENEECLNRFITLNKNKSIPNWKIEYGFTIGAIRKCVTRIGGFEDWLDFRRKESIHNHRIISIEYLPEEIEVGTLTIDQNELFHNHHTFALSCGVFTKNSNLGNMEDVEYFQNKLFQALNVPISRLKSDSAFSLGRSSEISRDEIKFSKFINRLRTKFSELFSEILKIQLIAKGIIREDEWEDLVGLIRYKYYEDNHFSELKDAEIIQNRLANLQLIDPYVGKYYSEEWVKKNVLKQTDSEMEDISKQIEEEALKNPQPETEEPEQS